MRRKQSLPGTRLPVPPVRPRPARGSRSSLVLGGVLIGTLVLGVAAADLLSPFAYDQITTRRDETPPTHPSADHWLGTDALGRDLATRLLHGARISLQVGVGAEVVAVLFGVAAGAVSGWQGGVIDSLTMRLVDIVLAVPTPLVILAVLAAAPDPRLIPGLGLLPHPEVALMILVLGAIGWAPLARLVRVQVRMARSAEYAEAARAVGAPAARILWRHLLPNCASPLLVAATLGVAGNVLTEAWLSFLGLGAPPPLPSLGSMITESQGVMTLHPRLVIAPGLAIGLAVLGFNLLGDGLRDRLDPRPDGAGSRA